MIEVLKQMYQLLLTEPHAPAVCDKLESMLRKAIAELESQEPVAWMSKDEHEVYTSKQVDGYFQHDHIPLYTTPPKSAFEIFAEKNT